MNEIFNFYNTSIIPQHNWVFVAAAFFVGAWVGFATSIPSKKSK